MKKLKYKILIPTVTTLASIALVVPATSIATKVANNSTNNSSIVNSINYVTVSYNTDTNVTLDGPTTSKARSGVMFGSIQKPRPIHSLGYVFKGWSTVKGDKSKVVTNDTTVSSNLSLYPIFEAEVEELVISGDDEILSTQTKQYTVKDYPTISTTSITWDVDYTGLGGTGTATINNGNLTVDAWAAGTVIVKAKDNNSGIETTKTVTVDYPFNKSDGFWILDDNSNWIRLKTSDICNETAQTNITYYNVDGVEQTTPITRASLDSSYIYIGNELTSVPDNFLSGWTTYNGAVIFPGSRSAGVGVSKCTTIGKCFMQNCSAYAGTQDLPEAIKMIDEGFMMGCEKFKRPITIPENTTIIGRNFMKGCKEFNDDLTIPASVTYVGDSFMTNCDAFCSYLTVNTDPDNFQATSSPFSNTLTTTSTDTDAYKNGVTIRSDTAGYEQQFIERFTNRESPACTSSYRMLLPETTVDWDEDSWANVIEWAEKVEAGSITATQFAAHYGKEIKDLIGSTKEITINGIAHTARLIDIQHSTDLIVEGTHPTSVPATLTFELSDVLTNSDGVITSEWDENYTNYDYTTSTLKNNLTGTPTWTPTTNAFAMLPTDISSHIKTVQKHYTKYDTGTSSYIEATYNDTLFPLTDVEIGDDKVTTTEEGSVYAYYDGATGDERVKYSAGTAKARQEYWLVSPYQDNPSECYYVETNGDCMTLTAGTEYPVSFAFCI